MNAHVIGLLKDLKSDDISRLVLVDELSEDIGSPGVRLTPLLGGRVVQIDAENTLSEVVHD